MVATTGVFVGYVVGFLYPNFLSGGNPGPLFMALVAIVFSFFVAWIAQKGAAASTAGKSRDQRRADLGVAVFSVLALGYRANHPSAHGFPVRRSDALDLHLPVRNQGRRQHRAKTLPASRSLRSTPQASRFLT